MRKITIFRTCSKTGYRSSNRSEKPHVRESVCAFFLLQIFVVLLARSGFLGRPKLPAVLPFSKPKVNWLLHLRKYVRTLVRITSIYR